MRVSSRPQRSSAAFRSVLVWGLLSLVLTASVSAEPQASLKETDVEKLLVQGDTYYIKGDYKLAIGCFLEASALSKNRMNLSKAYFGLSVCYFYLQDSANSAKYLRRVMDIDPQKEISELFYPKEFVQLFAQVKLDAGIKGAAPTETVAPPKPVVPKTETDQKAKDEAKKEEGKKEGAAADVAPPSKPPVRTTLAPVPNAEEIAAMDETKGGHWEIGAHYSWWSVNLLKSLFVDKLTEEVGKDIQNNVVKLSGTVQAGLVKLAYVQALSFDSSGTNTGLEIRYFSKGRAGTFSLGVAFEKTYIKLALMGTAKQDYLNGGTASADVKANLQMSPFSLHANFRWEMGSNRRMTPYLVLGLGFAPLQGTYDYALNLSFKAGNVQEIRSKAEEKTFDQLSHDVDFGLPDLFIILQLNFGLKAELTKGLCLLGEAGIWDGLILRGGLSYRFQP